MKIDKSLKEVWSWKDEIYKETKEITMEERVKMIKENATKIKQRYGLQLKIVNNRKSGQTV